MMCAMRTDSPRATYAALRRRLVRPRPATTFVSDCLTTRPVEGAETVALQLARRLQSTDRVLCRDRVDLEAHWEPVLTQTWIPWRALGALRRRPSDEVVWLPEGGLNYAVLVRVVVVRLLLPRTRLTLVLLQRHRTPSARLMRPWSRVMSVVAANATDLRLYHSYGWSATMLEVDASEDRVSACERHEARERLGLPHDQPVFLHVGHATRGRNLLALGPLSAEGVLMLVLSPHSPMLREVLPEGPGVRSVHERVTVSDYYRAADVYVFPTVDRHSTIGVPMSIVEAVANGLPVVARRSGLTSRWEDHPLVRLADSDQEMVAAARELVARAAGPETV